MAGGIVNVILRCLKQGSGMRDLSDETEKALGNTRDMSKALQALGVASAGAGRLVKSVLTGGLWEVGAAGLKYIIEKVSEYKERAIKAARESAKEFADAMSNAAKAIEDRFKKVSDALARTAARAKELLGLENTRGGVRQALGVSELNEQERSDLAKARDESEREIIKANYAIRRTKLENAERLRQVESECAESEENITRANKRLIAARDALTHLEWQRESAEAQWKSAIRKDDDELVKTTGDALAKANEAVAAARQRVADEEARLASAQTASANALLKRNQARIDAQDREAASEFALAEANRKAAEAAEKKAESERKAAAAAEEAAKKQQLEQVNRELDEQDEAFRAHERDQLLDQLDADTEMKKKQLAQMLPELKSLDKRIGALTLRLKSAEDGVKRGERGRAADARHTNGLFGTYEYGGRSNGGENFTDWQRGQRYADRADRDAQKAARRDRASQKRYDRLSDEARRGRRLSARDRKFMGDWEAYQDQKDNAEKARGELEAAQQKRDKLQEEMKGLLQSIDKNLKDAIGVG